MKYPALEKVLAGHLELTPNLASEFVDKAMNLQKYVEDAAPSSYNKPAHSKLLKAAKKLLDAAVSLQEQVDENWANHGTSDRPY